MTERQIVSGMRSGKRTLQLGGNLAWWARKFLELDAEASVTGVSGERFEKAHKGLEKAIEAWKKHIVLALLVLAVGALAGCGATTGGDGLGFGIDPQISPPSLDAGQEAVLLPDGGWAVFTPGVDCSEGGSNDAGIPCCPGTYSAEFTCSTCVFEAVCPRVFDGTACPTGTGDVICENQDKRCCNG